MTVIVVFAYWRRKIERTRVEVFEPLPALALLERAHEIRLACDPSPEARLAALALGAELRRRTWEPTPPRIIRFPPQPLRQSKCRSTVLEQEPPS